MWRYGRRKEYRGILCYNVFGGEIQSCKYRLCACTHAAVAACATQVPLITVTELLRKRLKADTLGNMVFWTFFCVLGQPMCLVL